MRRIPAVLLALVLALLPLSGCEEGLPLPAPSTTAVSTAAPSSPPTSDTPVAGATTPAASAALQDGLNVHFIDVGQADAALLTCGGQAMLIDGGNVDDSSLVVSYLENQGISHLDYVLCTHAHEDHVGGLSGPLNTCTVSHVLAPVTEYDSKAFEDFSKYTQAQGLSIEVPTPGDTFSLGQAQVTILGPVKEYEDTNNTSIVLRVDYGQTSFLFTGDMERQAEEDLLQAGCQLEATVLKVGHHGSDTSTSYPFLRAVMPQYAVISVGAGNSYGHPSEDTLSRLSDADVTVYRTDQQGTVVAYSDGTQVTFQTGKEVAPSPGRTEAAEQVYIGNTNSHVFHLETCSSLPAEQNQIVFDSRDAAVEAGYTPCSRCKP